MNERKLRAGGGRGGKRARKEEDERKIGREIAIKRDKNLESIRSKRKCIHFVGVHTY